MDIDRVNMMTSDSHGSLLNRVCCVAVRTRPSNWPDDMRNLRVEMHRRAKLDLETDTLIRRHLSWRRTWVVTSSFSSSSSIR